MMFLSRPIVIGYSLMVFCLPPMRLCCFRSLPICNVVSASNPGGFTIEGSQRIKHVKSLKDRGSSLCNDTTLQFIVVVGAGLRSYDILGSIALLLQVTLLLVLEGIDGHDAIRRDNEATLSKLLPPSICESPTIGFKTIDVFDSMSTKFGEGIDGHDAVKRDFEPSLRKLLPPSIFESPTIGYKILEDLLKKIKITEDIL
ncbi:hypothetical protein Tco_0507850 [Tanacetum coccineum]